MVKSGTEYIGEDGDILFFMLDPSQYIFVLSYLMYVHVCDTFIGVQRNVKILQGLKTFSESKCQEQ